MKDAPLGNSHGTRTQANAKNALMAHTVTPAWGPQSCLHVQYVQPENLARRVPSTASHAYLEHIQTRMVQLNAYHASWGNLQQTCHPRTAWTAIQERLPHHYRPSNANAAPAARLQPP